MRHTTMICIALLPAVGQITHDGKPRDARASATTVAGRPASEARRDGPDGAAPLAQGYTQRARCGPLDEAREEVVVDSFDMPSNRASRPGFAYLAGTPSDAWSSQSPLDNMVLRLDGKGAHNSRGYLAVIGTGAYDYAAAFYAESTPYWWTPSRTFDLRRGSVTFYLSEINPIRVASADYQPRLFIIRYMPHEGGTTIVLKQPLRIGAAGTWAFNSIRLSSDAARWVVQRENTAVTQLSISEVLCQAGFVGVGYNDLRSMAGANPAGILGIDDFRYSTK